MNRRLALFVGLLILILPAATILAGGPLRTHIQVEGEDHIVCTSGALIEGHFWANDNWTQELEGTILTVDGHYVGHGELTPPSGDTYQDHQSLNYAYQVDLATGALLNYSQSGNTRHLFLPGDGTLYHDAGSIYINALTGEVVIHGHFELFQSGLDVCGWFGEGQYDPVLTPPTTILSYRVLGPRQARPFQTRRSSSGPGDTPRPLW